MYITDNVYTSYGDELAVVIGWRYVSRNHRYIMYITYLLYMSCGGKPSFGMEPSFWMDLGRADSGAPPDLTPRRWLRRCRIARIAVGPTARPE